MGDRRHFSHRLVARGLTPPQAVWTIDLVTLAGGLGALFCTGSTGRARAWCWPRPAACWGSWPSWNSRRAVRSKRNGQTRRETLGPLQPEAVADSRTRDRARHGVDWPTTDDPSDESAASIPGERVRRIALGLTAALMTARAFWPSEPDLKEGAGDGIVLGARRLDRRRAGPRRRRWSAAGFDSAGRGPTRWSSRSWSWSRSARRMRSTGARRSTWPGSGSALGLVYLLLRNLPRTRDESSVLAGALVATAFAVSVYGLYQVKVELPLHPGRVPAQSPADSCRS